MEKVRTTSLEELFDLLGVDAESVAEARRELDAYILEWQLAQVHQSEELAN